MSWLVDLIAVGRPLAGALGRRIDVKPCIWILSLALAVSVAEAGTSTWSSFTGLDPREALEIGGPLPGAADGLTYPVVTLFGTAPQLQLLRVDHGVDPPTATAVTIVASGSIFAVGPAGKTLDGVLGGVYIDNFVAKFWRSSPPYTTATVVPVTTLPGAIVDVSGAATGNFFWAGALNASTGAYEVLVTPNAGQSWTRLRTLTPQSGFYINFFGGERISLVVDPAGTNPASTRNGIFYEVPTGASTGPGTTEKRFNFGIGNNVIFDAVVATDVPNPQGAFDKYIENRCSSALGLAAICLISRRQTQEVRVARIDPDGVVTSAALGSVPSGNSIFSYGLASSGEFSYAAWPAGEGVPGNFRKIDFGLNPIGVESLPGPPQMQQGAVNFNESIHFVPSGLYLGGYYNGTPSVSEGGATGFGTATFQLTLFADGFESGDTSAWSVTVP